MTFSVANLHTILPVFALLMAMSMLLTAVPVQGQAAQVEDFLVPDRKTFLGLLDLNKPALVRVEEALNRGDVEAAGSAYAAYFRAKEVASPLLTNWRALERNPKCNTATADGYLAGHLHDGYSAYDVPATGLDWRNCPLSCLTRFPILGPLRSALWHTGDPKYVRFIMDHLLGYIQAYPIEEFPGKKTREGWVDHVHVAKPWYWCMIPEQLTEMSETIALLRRYPQVSDEEILQILQRMYQEIGYLSTEIKPWVDLRHNGGCAMIESMAQGCAILEDFPKAREWLAYDAKLAAQYIDQAFYPDGMCVELTTAYSAEVSAVTQRMAEALKTEEAIKIHKDKIASLVTCQVALADPTGLLPSFGDLYASNVTRGVHERAADWLNLPWTKTVLANARGVRPRPADPLPPFTVWPAPGQEQWCGYYTMRSDWTPEAKYLAIDGGPWGTTHQHGDKLSLVVTAYGKQFIIDPSSTRYASNEPEAFISVQRSGFLHNSITIDGVDEFMSEGSLTETKEPLRNTWEHGPGYTLFASTYSFVPVKPVRWERRVVFVDRKYWLLQDVLSGQPNATQLEQNYQFEAGIEIEFQDNRTIAKASNGARLVLLPLEGSLKPQLTIGDKAPHTSYWPDGKPKQVLCREDGHDQVHGRGWTGRSSDKLIPAPAVTYTGQVTLPATITVALIPLAPDQKLADLPHITSRVLDGQTTWYLPAAGRTLQFATSLTSCAVTKP